MSGNTLHTPAVDVDVTVDVSSQRGIDYNYGKTYYTGTHISDTHIMRWEIYYAHLQSGRMLFLDTLSQASGTLQRQNLCIYRNRQINTSGLRITAI